MTPHLHSPHFKRFAQVTLATVLVAGTPVAVVWWLRASGTVSSAGVTLLFGVALSLVTSSLGRIFWEKRQGSDDLLFSELMVWGYIHRWCAQRRVADAAAIAGSLSLAEAHRPAVDAAVALEQTRLLQKLVSAMETRDPYLHGHSRRVARYSWMIARHMKLPAEQVARVRAAAAIHDVGKTKTPKTILHKAGGLSDEEYGVIKQHPGDGAEMAAVLGDPDLTAMIRHHHERLDGSGYPDGLHGDQIPLGARIIAVADTFDAITSARPYRAASPHKKAIDIMRAEAGTQLDRDVVRAFCGHYAGRGPLALWSFLCSVPERVLSWLSASAASVAAVGKVAAVAALMGAAAATSATLGLSSPGAHDSVRARHARTGSAPQHAAFVLAAAPGRAGSPTGEQAPGTSHGSGPAHGRGVGHRRAPTPGSTPYRPAAGGVVEGGVGGDEEAAARGGTEEPSGGEAPHKAVKEQAPAKGRSEEAPAKGRTEEAPAKGKSEEAPGLTKPEPTPGGKPEEPANAGGSGKGPGKPEAEAPPKGKSGEPH